MAGQLVVVLGLYGRLSNSYVVGDIWRAVVREHIFKLSSYCWQTS